MNIIYFMVGCIVFLTPRFVTDRYAMSVDENGEWFVLCLDYMVEENLEFFEEMGLTIDGWGSLSTFTWLGFITGGEIILEE